MKITIKNQIYILLFSVIGLIVLTISFNAKKHIDTVEVVDELAVQKDSLDKTVKVLIHTQDSVLSKIETLDSVLTSKDSVIDTQKNRIVSLKRLGEELKMKTTSAPIIIRDTIYITEKKNFWGRTKKSIESVSDTTIMMEEMEEETTIDSTENK